MTQGNDTATANGRILVCDCEGTMTPVQTVLDRAF